MRRIPEQGIRGEVALREAAAGEFHDIMKLVRRALEDKLRQPGQRDVYVPVEAIFTDRVVVMESGRYLAYPYTLNDNNQITLGNPTEVTKDYMPVAMREAQGAFLEAKDDQGLKWQICIIKAGLSGNKNYYRNAVLREAVPLFEGVRVFVKSDEEHLKGKGKAFNNLIGRIVNPVFIEGQGTDNGQINADLELLKSAGDVPVKMLEAFNKGMANDLFGFSIDAEGTANLKAGRRVANKITKVSSVDLIIEPGAGGQIINLIEALNPEVEADMKLRERMIGTVKKAHNGSLPDGLDIDNDEDLEKHYREALAQDNPTKSEAAAGAGDGEPSPANTGVSKDELDSSIRMVEARAHARVAIAESGLPDLAKTKLRDQFTTMVSFTEAQVDEAITAEREYLAKFTESGHVVDLGGGSRIESGEGRSDKVGKMLDAFFDPNNREVNSFRECYIDITGDRRVTGHMKNCDAARLREAISNADFREALDSTSFANVLGDSVARRMVADYNQPSQYDVWRQLATVVPVNDFRTQERTRFGGYGDLPVVAENGAYAALTSPGDEAANYAVAKRGGEESISIEMIKNDDVGAIQRIPIRMSRAGKRTLGKFVLDFLATNPLIYDGVALFDVAHNNLGAAALDATSLAARRLAMLKQTELGSSERLGIGPQNLWVPADMEEVGVNLFRRNTENDKSFTQSLSLNVIPVWYWTDINDWCLSADPMDIPTIEIGFLDGNEEPELFVQDSPTQGSLFSNDQIKYKIRHIYGGNVLDFRGLDKSVVA
ncbi:MAG TPA: hypothetical protein ENJ65_01825 [Candidatus Tenderia electrophaga]|uniref:Bacteriophage Mu GpT domain-containing protein n=1 Tax=Candidatus Tenderia electrophaga TaxID=1748243 RepID=A0A832J8F0_9GAMM|nr:hypothetical protein [Candidatus Tenderia electrophaga]